MLRHTLLLAIVLPALASAQPATPAATPPPPTPPAAAPSAAAPAVTAPTAPPAARAVEFKTFTTLDGTPLRYALVLPDAFDPVKAYPTLLALPPGDQSEDMVRRGLDLYWLAARARGWVVLSPVAPPGKSFVDSAATLIPELLADAAKTARPENGLVHLAGASNGGRAAFRAAIDSPGQFASLLVLPGVPPLAADSLRLDRLKTVPVTMFVGQSDNDYWVSESKKAAQTIKDQGGECTLRVLEGQGHVLKLDPAELFDQLDRRRPAARAAQLFKDAANRAIGQVLDDFHDAAAKADEDRYFAHFAPGAVFLGTDATERWTAEQFKIWAQPYFQRGSAWAYTPGRRWITVSPAGDTAWFDETLQNAKLGDCRGSGVLIRTPQGWKLTQYNLTVPIPNEVMGKVIELVAAHHNPPSAPAPAPTPAPTPGPAPAQPK